MKQNQASRTAEYMALFRAIESSHPEGIRLFEDQFAQEFLRPSLQIVATLSRILLFHGLITWLIDSRWPGARSSGVARNRLIDDALVKALQDGIDQVVILGAGFDCRAYRIPGIDRTRVYEVDHPSTLTVKHERLRRVLGKLPTHVVLAEIDFNHQRLGDVLAGAGFDASRRTFFIWEGVTNYLSGEAVDATLRFISTVEVGSLLIFTYIHQGVLDDPAGFAGTHNLIQLLQKEDETWTFRIYPAELPSYLEERGFALIEEIGSVEYRARYIKSAGRHMQGYEFYRIALARVMQFDVSMFNEKV